MGYATEVITVTRAATMFTNLEKLKLTYSDALTVFFHAVQGSVEEFQALGPWLSNSHSLALKMFRHLSSVNTLCQMYTDVPPGHPPSHYIDFSSAQIVTRAAIETYLTFAYVFCNDDLTLAKFRCEIWQLSGLADRAKLLPASVEAEKTLAADKGQMEELRISIAKSPHLAAYTEKQARRILAGGWSQLRDWSELAVHAGIHPRYFDQTYNHLSGFSHSSYISAIQISQARDMHTQLHMAQTCVQMSLFYTAHFVVNFSKISASAALFISSDDAAKKFLKLWHITSEDWAKIYAEQDVERMKRADV